MTTEQIAELEKLLPCQMMVLMLAADPLRENPYVVQCEREDSTHLCPNCKLRPAIIEWVERQLTKLALDQPAVAANLKLIADRDQLRAELARLRAEAAKALRPTYDGHGQCSHCGNIWHHAEFHVGSGCAAAILDAALAEAGL